LLPKILAGKLAGGRRGSAGEKPADGASGDVADELRQTFLSTHETMKSEGLKGGTTAIVSLLLGNKVGKRKDRFYKQNFFFFFLDCKMEKK
jgi:hypothetical protein